MCFGENDFFIRQDTSYSNESPSIKFKYTKQNITWDYLILIH